jgi:hypothetical protein
VAASTDCGNAFNSLDRVPIALVLHCDDFNPLWSYWQLLYGEPTLLRVFHNNRSTDLISSRGTRQGDPTASALFCLGMQPVLLRTSQLHPNVHILAFMDDIYVVANRMTSPPPSRPSTSSLARSASAFVVTSATSMAPTPRASPTP